MARRSGVEMERTATAQGAVLARVVGALAQEAGCIVERWLDRLERTRNPLRAHSSRDEPRNGLPELAATAAEALLRGRLQAAGLAVATAHRQSRLAMGRAHAGRGAGAPGPAPASLEGAGAVPGRPDAWPGAAGDGGAAHGPRGARRVGGPA